MASWAAIAKTEAVRAVPAAPSAEAKPRTAVIDANAIINGNGLLNLMRCTDRAVTIPEVLREVRDKQSRSWLASLPYTIEVLEPSEESLKAVTGFARATGDMHALSVVDTRLLALAHTLEVAYYGDSHLKSSPAPPKVQSKGAVDSKTLPGWGAAGGDWADMDRLNEEELAAAEAAISHGGEASRIAAGVQQLSLHDAEVSSGALAADVEAVLQQLDAAGLRGDDTDAAAAGGAEAESNAPSHQEAAAAAAAGVGVAGAFSDGDSSSGEEEEGDGGWEVAAKTRNKARRAKRRQLRHDQWQAEALEQQQQEEGEGASMDEAAEEEEEEDEQGEEGGEEASGFESAVVSVTADFAMQNVLLQMGLRLSAPDGRRITTVTRWVLRCTACFVITKDVGRLFCPRCGNAALDRVRVTVGADGTEQYGVKKKHVLRGTRFSLPRPRGGRAPDIILAEDQLLAKSHLLRAQKKAAEVALDPFAPEYGEATWHQAASLPPNGPRSAALLAGWKRNPNERKHVATNRRRK